MGSFNTEVGAYMVVAAEVGRSSQVIGIERWDGMVVSVSLASVVHHI